MTRIWRTTDGTDYTDELERSVSKFYPRHPHWFLAESRMFAMISEAPTARKSLAQGGAQRSQSFSNEIEP